MDGDELSQHLIYRPSSPEFDIPDYLPIRRVKPLPKRKRSSPGPAGPLPLDTMLPPVLPPPPGPDATAEELIAHAEVLSAQITFQSYFLPSISGVTDFSRHSLEAPSEAPLEFDMSLTDDQDGDQMEHLRQPGNAKKRKVPAHLSGSQMGPDSTDVHSGDEEQPAERAAPRLASSGDAAEDDQAFATGIDVQRGKMLPATLVGLQQKEILKHRRRQLATALAAPTLADSLAMDQALLADYALLHDRHATVSRNARLKSRVLRRRATRAVRRHRPSQSSPPPPEPARRTFPASDFTFMNLSTASERLMAMRAEYALLHGRFKDELARQAEKAAESAKEAAAAAKRSERAVRKARAAAAATVMAAAQTPQDTDTGAAVKSPSPAKASGKKKKRSALANASNPHHLRNYVPSRIPNQGHLNAAQLGTNAQNLLSPLPLLFLSAQIPPRRGAAVRPLAAASQLANPAEEWICPSCEYRLFYGDEQAYRTGVRNRKKILKRRRRARERAAAAANGSGTGVGVAAGGKGSVVDDEEDLDFETGGSGLAPEPTRFAGGGEGRRFEGGGVAGG